MMISVIGGIYKVLRREKKKMVHETYVRVSKKRKRKKKKK